MKPIFGLYVILCSTVLQFKHFKLEPEQIITFMYCNSSLFDIMLFIKYTVPLALGEIIHII